MSTHPIIHLAKITGVAGAEGHLLTLLAGLRARGVPVELWILVEPDNPVQVFVDRAAALDIPLKRIVIRRDLDPGLWWQLAHRFREIAPSIVHTHMFHADLYGTLAARRTHVPAVISSRHNDDRFRTFMPVRLLNAWLWRRVDVGIAISESIRQFSINVEHAPADRIVTVHYGLDPASIHVPADARAGLRHALGLPPEALLVGSICRLTEQKGLIYGLKGFARIAEAIPEAHYVIAGNGPLRAMLTAEAESLKLDGRVHFLGWRDDAHAIFAALDVFLAPSLWEGFGLVFLEAMALGIPIISTRVSAIPEVIVDGHTGWLVPPGDAAAIASALREALTHLEERTARGVAGRQRLDAEFTVDAMVEHTLAVYRKVEHRL